MGLYKYGVSWIIFVWILVLFPDQVFFIAGLFLSPSFIRIRYLLIYVLILYLLGYIFKKWIVNKHISSLNYFLNIFVFILMAVVLQSGIQNYLKEIKHKKYLQKKEFSSLKVKDNNDVIWILLDEYTSPASLKSQFNFKTSLVDSLNNKGFFVFNDLHSRSDVTVLSINSLFNLDDSIPSSNHSYAADYLNKSIWVKNLKKNGYEFVSSDFLNVGGNPKLLNLSLFPDNYSEILLNRTLITSMRLTVFSDKKELYDYYNQQAIMKFYRDIHVKRSGPSFIWTHLLIPHTPFYRDAHGKLNAHPIEVFDVASSKEIAKQYTDYLSYANTVVLKMLNGIPDWKNKTIIISGDHGARMLIPENDPRRKKTFCAIYYPGMDKQKISKIKYMQQIPFYLH